MIEIVLILRNLTRMPIDLVHKAWIMLIFHHWNNKKSWLVEIQSSLWYQCVILIASYRFVFSSCASGTRFLEECGLQSLTIAKSLSSSKAVDSSWIAILILKRKNEHESRWYWSWNVSFIAVFAFKETPWYNVVGELLPDRSLQTLGNFPSWKWCSSMLFAF